MVVLSEWFPACVEWTEKVGDEERPHKYYCKSVELAEVAWDILVLTESVVTMALHVLGDKRGPRRSYGEAYNGIGRS